MKLDSLDGLNDSELQAVIERSELLLKNRDGERKAKALSDAKVLLASVGLSLKDVAQGKLKPVVKAAVYRGGVLYRHPANASLTWNAKGQKPAWLRELEAQGKRAVEAAAESRA